MSGGKMLAQVEFIKVDLATVNNVIQWAHDRNLIYGCGPKDQALKLGSEISEIMRAHDETDLDEFIDGIGDSLVVSIILSEQLGLPLVDAMSRLTAVDVAELFNVTKPLAKISGHIGIIQDYVLKGQHGLASRAIAELAIFLDRVAFSVVWGPDNDLNTCLSRAYEVIKDRKGIMHNGSFVKESDPAYPGIVAEIARKSCEDKKVLEEFAELFAKS